MAATAARPKSLSRDRGFLTLWVGQSVSELGTQVTTLVLPLLAVTVMAANTVEVGILRACAYVAVLLASIPAGVIVDRSRKWIVMLVANVGRALFLASIPLSWFFHVLTIGQLYVVAFLNGMLAIAFTVAAHAYYPILVTREQLPEANSKFGATEAFARVSGPGVGATLAALIGAATTILVDVFSYVVSTTALLLSRTPADLPEPTRQKVPLHREARVGFRLVTANSVLARTASTTVAAMFCLAMTDAVFVYYLVHDLHLSTVLVGAVYTIGEIGGLVAAILATRIMRRVGTARIMWLVMFLSPAGYLAAAATRPTAVVLTALSIVLTSTRFVLFDIAQYSYRQLVCPLGAIGKVNATIRLGVGGAMAAGALIGGLLGAALGARGTIIVATSLTCLAALPVLFSQLRRTRDVDDLESLTLPEQESERVSGSSGA